MPLTLAELAERIDATLEVVDPLAGTHRVTGCAALDQAGPEEVSFLANQKYASHLEETQAAAIIVGPGVEVAGKTLLVAKDPYFAFRNAVVALHGFRNHPEPVIDAEIPPDPSILAGREAGLISPQAVVHPTAKIGAGTRIHPYVIISEGVTIGDRGVIYPHCFIGPDASLGEQVQLYPNVTIYDRCTLGDRVTLHAGCVIGQDGFGYATHQGAHHKIPQSGNVIVGDDVEMGANCSVDRATVGSTVIGSGTKFSNSVTIGHGTRVGRHNLYVALCGIAGSVTTGDYVIMGGQSGVAGHLKIGNMVRVAGGSGVINDIPDGAEVGGFPARTFTDTKRSMIHYERLPTLNARVKKIERKINQLLQRHDDGDEAD